MSLIGTVLSRRKTIDKVGQLHRSSDVGFTVFERL